MSEDYRVNGRTDQQVRGIANRVKRAFKVDRLRPVNIVRCLESGWIETEHGKKCLIFQVVADVEMGNDDGRTDFSPGVVTVSVKRSVYDMAIFGEGRARMTLAHELGHAVMHEGAPKFRGTSARGKVDAARVKVFESAEHQAKVFASAFLIHDEVASQLRTSDDISEDFNVSLEAARICFERLEREAERAASAERVERVIQDFKAVNSEPKHQLHFTGEPCTTCGQTTVMPVGIKYLCVSCDRVSDQHPDGD